jgi:phosphoglycerate dehydrogenase-like enzyme
MAAKVRDGIRSELPPGFSIEFAQSTDCREHLAMVADAKLRESVWLRPQLRAWCYQLSGKTIGLLGFGNVSRMVAHRLAGFEGEIIYSDIRRADMTTRRRCALGRCRSTSLIERSDVLSIHVPLTQATKGA